MQKFEEADEALSERRNIVVMADEAHRGAYGLTERIRLTHNEEGQEIAKTRGRRGVSFGTVAESTYQLYRDADRGRDPQFCARYSTTISTSTI